MYVLQALTPDQLDSTVKELSESAIQLAEAASNYGALKVIFGIFVIIVIFMLIFFFYQVISMNKKIVEVHQSTKKINDFIEDKQDKRIGKGQTVVLIRRSFITLSQNIKYIILRTRLEGAIDNQEYLKSKIGALMSVEYAELKEFLANFEYDDKVVSEFINTDDCKIISDFINEQIFIPKSEFSVSEMDQSADILIQGIRQNALRLVS